ncbi:MAG: NUDIX domain-containing protein [Myxococcota bacterium]
MPRTIPDDEAEFLRSYDPGAFERPSVAVDTVVLCVDDQRLKVVLSRRRDHPYLGAWALPGTFVRIDEPLEDAVVRSLSDKAGLRLDHLEQLYTFGAPGRDPRLRVISVAWLAVVRPGNLPALPDGVVLGDVHVGWEGEAGGPASASGPGGAGLPLAFDHADILGTAVQRVRGKLGYTDLGFAFLAPTFTLRDVRLVWETLLGRALNKDSFRRTVLTRHPLIDTGERQSDVGHRPAALYRLALEEEE